MSTSLSRRPHLRRLLAALTAAAALALTMGCGNSAVPGPTMPTDEATVQPGDSAAPAVGYFVSGGLKPMGDQLTVSADGTAVLETFNKEVARCTLVDPQATSIRELAEQADLAAVGPSPKASKVQSPDMRVTGLLYGDVRVDSARANAGAEPWPSLLTTLRAVYAELLQIRATGSSHVADPKCR